MSLILVAGMPVLSTRVEAELERASTHEEVGAGTRDEVTDAAGELMRWIRADMRLPTVESSGAVAPDHRAKWWVGFVPAVTECSIAEVALELALARLSAEIPEASLVGLLPRSMPKAHPIWSQLEATQWIQVPDERFRAFAAVSPLPRLVVVSASGTLLLDASIPRGMADEEVLLDLLASYRSWALEAV